MRRGRIFETSRWLKQRSRPISKVKPGSATESSAGTSDVMLKVVRERLRAGLDRRLQGDDRRVAPKRRKRNQLEDRLKELMQELGNAINESLSDSDRIAAAIGEIKRAGYDVFLVLEATIGFNKREDADESEEGDTIELNSPPENTTRRKVGKIKLTSQDQKFLRALKIAIDDEGR